MSESNALVEKVARAICIEQGVKPDRLDDGFAQWRYFTDHAKRVIPLILERAAEVLDAEAQEMNQRRDPGMANHDRKLASAIRALATSATDREKV